MTLDFIYIVNYECPGCLVALEARSNNHPTWLRCPRCGRASMPPDQQRQGWDAGSPLSMATSSPGGFAVEEGTMPLGPRSMAPLPPITGARPSNLRILLGLGFFVTLFLSVFSLLDSNPVLAGISGVAALVFLSLAVMSSGRGKAEE